MMVLFLHAARLAMVVFDPYLSSRPLAEALLKAPPGELIEDNAYYTFSSVFFYANRRGLLLNGRQTNLEYGSYAPDCSARLHRRLGFREALAPGAALLFVSGRSVVAAHREAGGAR